MIPKTKQTAIIGTATVMALSMVITRALAASMPPVDPQAFVTKAARGGLAEVELSKLATTHAHAPDVRTFATKMVQDHTKANSELQTVAQRKGLHVPTDADAEHRELVKSLTHESGTKFDADYMAAMKKDHDATVALFEAEAGGSDRDLQAFAAKTLPTLKVHRDMATDVASGKTGASHSGGTAQ